MTGPQRVYKPVYGDFAGQEGVMVGRFCDPSYDDIELMFDCGSCRWFRFSDVREFVTEPAAATDGHETILLTKCRDHEKKL